jgi:hypothetical protein
LPVTALLLIVPFLAIPQHLVWCLFCNPICGGGKPSPSRLLRAPLPLQAGMFPRNAPRSPNTPQPDRVCKPLGRFAVNPLPLVGTLAGAARICKPRQAQSQPAGEVAIRNKKRTKRWNPCPPRFPARIPSRAFVSPSCCRLHHFNCSAPPVARLPPTHHRLTSRGKRLALRCKPTPFGRDACRAKVASHGPSVAIPQP